jgi:hypothetical protein
MASIEEMLRALMQDRGRFGTVNYSPGMADVAKKALLGEQNEIEKRNLARRASPQGPKTPLQAVEDLFKKGIGAYERSLEGDDREALLDILRSTPMVEALVGPRDTSQTPDLESEYKKVPLDPIDPESSQLAGHIATEYPDDALTLDGDAVLSADGGGSPPPIVNALVGPIKSALADVTAVNEPVSEAQRIMAALEGFKPKTPAGRNLREQFIATQYQEQALQERADTERAYAAQLLEEEREWEIELERIKAGLGKEGAGHRWGTAIQYTNRMTELRAQIAAIPDENSPERIVLQQELDDLLYNVARDPYALGEVSRHKARGTGRGTTAAEREGDMRGIRTGILIKHDRLPLLQNTTDQIKELADGMFTSGLTGHIASFNPGSDQYQMNKLIKNIHGAIGLEELIAVKARGATFGALSDTEMELLIASIQALDPLLPADTLKDNLDSVMRLYEKGLNTSKQNFREVYGEDERRPWEPPPDSGVAQELWDLMTPEQKRAFE